VLYLVVPSGCSGSAKLVEQLLKENYTLCFSDFLHETVACPREPGEEGYLVLFPECGIVPARFQEIAEKLKEIAEREDVVVVTANAVLASDLAKYAEEVSVSVEDEHELEWLKQIAEVEEHKRVGKIILARLRSWGTFSDILECV